MSPLEAVILVSLAIWFAFYLVNYAALTAKVRAGLLPTLPRWMTALVTCPLCATFWALAAMSLFLGYTPFMWYCPPVVLFIDLVYRRLRMDEPPVLPPPAPPKDLL